jgi:hypothetical protein
MTIGQSNTQEVCWLACDSTNKKQSEVYNWCSLREAFAAERPRAYICNFQRQPVFTHCNQFLSDATCPGKHIDTSTTPVFGCAGYVRQVAIMAT